MFFDGVVKSVVVVVVVDCVVVIVEGVVEVVVCGVVIVEGVVEVVVCVGVGLMPDSTTLETVENLFVLCSFIFTREIKYSFLILRGQRVNVLE